MQKEEVFIGSGCVYDDSGCGCSMKIPIKTWKECKTLMEKIGFIFGKIIKFLGRRFQDIFSFINRVVKITRLDKLTNLFLKFLGKCRDKIKNATIRIFNKLIYPIFCNKCTKKIANSIYEKFLSPLGKTIKTIVNAIFVKFLWKTVICNPLTRKIFCRRPKGDTAKKTNRCAFCKNFKKRLCKALKSIADWTVMPIWNRIIWPIVIKIWEIGEKIFIGAASGICHESKKKAEKRKSHSFLKKSKFFKFLAIL
jgi:hypothetical protein